MECLSTSAFEIRLNGFKHRDKSEVMVKRFVTACLLVLAAPISVVAQDGSGVAAGESRHETEERLTQLKAQIEEDQRRLTETAEAERATMETLQNYDRQIALREELIRNYRRRVRQINYESDTLRTTLTTLEADLNRLKRQYQTRAEHAYKYGRMHDMALILSAQSINQMLIRVRYLHRFAEKRRTRLSHIVDAGAEVRERRTKLEEMLARNEQLLLEAEREQRNLERLTQSRRRVVTELRQQRSTIEESLEQSQTAARELENRIRELAATASTRRRIAAAADPAAAAEFSALTGSFQQNRGRLPWPTPGVVREPFGDITNPIHGTKTPNPGILIDTPASAEVRTIFDGQIIDVSILPEYGTYVVIEHGEFKTVYSNFSMTYSAEGDRVKAGDVIGRAGTDAEPRGNAVFFGLFKGGAPIDPVPWLRPR